MELSCSNIEKFLIFQETETLKKFQETETLKKFLIFSGNGTF